MFHFSELWYKNFSTFLFIPKQRVNKSYPFSASNLEMGHLICVTCYIYINSSLVLSHRFDRQQVVCDFKCQLQLTLFVPLFTCLKIGTEIHSIGKEHQNRKPPSRVLLGYRDGTLAVECRLPGSLSDVFSVRLHQSGP